MSLDVELVKSPLYTLAVVSVDDVSQFGSVSDWLKERAYGRFASLRAAALFLSTDRGAFGTYVHGEKVPPDELLRRYATSFGDDVAGVLRLGALDRERRVAGMSVDVGQFSPQEAALLARLLSVVVHALEGKAQRAEEAR